MPDSPSPNSQPEKAVEQALRDSESLFRTIIEIGPDEFVVHDMRGNIFDVNQTACDNLGYSREELLAMEIRDIEVGISFEDGRELWERVALGTAATVQGVQQRKNGTTFPVEVRVGVFEFQGEKLIFSVARDITGRQQAEEAQREFAVLEERNRLARELHDSVTQSLYSLTLFAEAGRRLADAGEWERVISYLGELGETSQQALKEMRLLVHQLLPLDLEQAGLVGALQQRLDAVEGRARVEAKLLVDSDLDLSPQIQAGFYRICLEALNNSLKHAAADQVTVRIGASQGEARLEIEDNGKGFDPDSLRDRGGLGLTSIRQRVIELGGSLDIISKPGQGTKVIVSVVDPG